MNDKDSPGSMSHRQLEGLFNEYSNSLGEPARQPSRRGRHRPRRLAVAAVTILLVAVAAVSLWPRDALAARLRRIGQVIKNAQTMEMTFSRLQPSGRWVQWLHTYYSEGVWRSDVEIGVGLKRTVVLRNGLMLSNYLRLDHATLGPAPKEEGTADFEEKSALDFAIGYRGFSSSDETTSKAIRDHDDVDGRPTYLIVFDLSSRNGPPTSEHTEILVDKQTDYPIRADITDNRPGENGGIFKLHQEYRFNEPIDPNLFALTSDKPIVDLRESSRRLAIAWAHPLAQSGPTEVRDASVTRDGTIWIAVTYTDADEPILPVRVSTPGNTEYARLWDLASSPMSGKSGGILVDGQPVLVVGFVPIDPVRFPPASAKILFGRRPAALPNFARPQGEDAPALTGSAQVPLKIYAGQCPDYFPLLDMDRITLELPADIWHCRAQALESNGRYLDAAHAYERTAKERENFVKYIAYRDLDKAAECYDMIGLSGDAARDRAAADALHAARER